jgi:hypothetical protein
MRAMRQMISMHLWSRWVATADTDTSGSQSDESDDIIVEGGEEIEGDLQPALDEKVAVTDSDGYRLIRGAKP